MPRLQLNMLLNPRSKGRNIVGQELPKSLDVACCVRLLTLLHVFANCCAKFETGQTFEPTNPYISFVLCSLKRSLTVWDPFAQLFQQFWGHVRALTMFSKVLRVVSFNDALQVPKLLGVAASVCT